MSDHTPTPWKLLDSFEDRLNGYAITSDGRLVASAWYMGGTERARANGEFIVKACNAHDAMDKLLAEAADYLNSHAGMDGMDLGNKITEFRRHMLADLIRPGTT